MKNNFSYMYNDKLVVINTDYIIAIYEDKDKYKICTVDGNEFIIDYEYFINLGKLIGFILND